jgi:predicted P-loop ATPase
MHVLYGLQAVRDVFAGKDVDLTPPVEFLANPESSAARPNVEPRVAAPSTLPTSPGDSEAAPPPGQEITTRVAPTFADWRARLIQGKEVAEGHPFPFSGKSKTNAYLFLKHHELFAGLLCYNEFTDAVMLTCRPPWDDGSRDFSPRSIRDDDLFMLAAHLEYCCISVSKETAADAAIRVAKENAVNPPREYLSRLAWDGRARLDTWLTYYLGADGQPSEYLALVGAKWLIGAVSRLYTPGCKFDNVLILEGPQGLGKSMALRSLATFNGEDFFLDSVGDIRSKDTLMTMQGKLIVEIAELASFKKTINEEIKAFVSRQVDEYRPPYGRTVVKRPRFFILAASTNEVDEGIFTDDTGNRRYWPVRCKSIDSDSVERDAPQLWAEAVARYQAGERAWLTRDEEAVAEKEQKKRLVEDAWMERIADIVKGEWMVRTDEILQKLEMKPKDINNVTKKRVKTTLKQLGWRETRRGGEGRVWRPEGVEGPPPEREAEASDLFD